MPLILAVLLVAAVSLPAKADVCDGLVLGDGRCFDRFDIGFGQDGTDPVEAQKASIMIDIMYVRASFCRQKDFQLAKRQATDIPLDLSEPDARLLEQHISDLMLFVEESC